VAPAFADFSGIDTLGCFGGIWNATRYREQFADALAIRVPTKPRIVYPGDVAMVGSFRLLLRKGPTLARPGEDAAVVRFESDLMAAKAAVG
jgi:hypothetical protein